jgi:hypothetical protein
MKIALISYTVFIGFRTKGSRLEKHDTKPIVSVISLKRHGARLIIVSITVAGN